VEGERRNGLRVSESFRDCLGIDAGGDRRREGHVYSQRVRTRPLPMAFVDIRFDDAR
jgi:hypothetical protein